MQEVIARVSEPELWRGRNGCALRPCPRNDGQTTGAPLRRPRASNLFEPVPGDHGAHGDFELRARDRDLLARVGVWLGSAGMHAVAAAFGVGVVVGASALIARGRR